MEKKCYFCENEIEKGKEYWEFPDYSDGTVYTTCFQCLDIFYENFKNDELYQIFKIKEEYIQKKFEEFKNEYLRYNKNK